MNKQGNDLFSDIMDAIFLSADQQYYNDGGDAISHKAASKKLTKRIKSIRKQLEKLCGDTDGKTPSTHGEHS